MTGERSEQALERLDLPGIIGRRPSATLDVASLIVSVFRQPDRGEPKDFQAR